MDDTWDVLILFLIAGIFGLVLYAGAITLFKKSVAQSSEIETPNSRIEMDMQSQKARQLKRDQDALLRDQRRKQEQMMRDTRQKIRDMQQR